MKKFIPKRLLKIKKIKSVVDFIGENFSKNYKLKNSLDKFLQKVDDKILIRGKNYFENGFVSSIEFFEDENLWEAVVSGTDDYYVSIKFENEKIVSWKCNCPYDKGPICKHVVATIGEIYFYDKKEKIFKNTLSRSKKIKQIIDRLSRKEINDFFQKNANSNLIDKLINNYSNLLELNYEKKCEQIIQNVLEEIINNFYLSEEEKERKISVILSLLDEADNFVTTHNFEKAAAVCRNAVEKIVNKTATLNGFFPVFQPVIEKSFQILKRIGEKAESKDFKKKLFYYYLDELEKWYYEISLKLEILKLLSYFIVSSKEEKKYLKKLDALIEKFKEETIINIDIVVELLKIKIDYLKKIGKEKDAEMLMKKNINFPYFREIFVKKEIENKNYKLAKSLVTQAIENDCFSYIWDDYLIQIAELQGDKNEVFKLAREEFFYTYEFEYYLKVKENCPEEKWKEEYEKILYELDEDYSHSEPLDLELFADIFIEEKDWERLLKLLKENVTYYFLIEKYAELLIDKFPNEILEIYKLSAVAEFDENNGKITDYVKNIIEKMKSIPNSKNSLDEVLKYIDNNNRKQSVNITFKITDEMIENK